MVVVGIVSPGAMGSAVGRVLAAGGARVVATVAGRSVRTAQLADGLQLLPDMDAVVRAARIVLSIVPPGEAIQVATDIAAALARTGASPIVADLNAVSPQTAGVVAEILAGAGIGAVDGSISGPPPHAAGTTTIYLAGKDATAVGSLAAPGIDFRVVGEAIGTASAIKMSTASVYKGQTALLAQALRAAAANGVLGHVLDDLGRNYPELVDNAPQILQRIAAKSPRYVAEMEQIASTQASAGLAPDLFEAMAVVYDRMSRTDAARRSPEEVDPAASLEDVLETLLEPPG